MFCMDRDRPDEAMFHWWLPNTPPLAVLVHLAQNSPNKIELTPIRLYKTDKGGGLIDAGISDDELEIVKAARGLIKKNKKSFEGQWTHPDAGSGRILLASPPQGPKITPKRCKTWNDFKKWASYVKAEEDVSLFRGHGSSNFRLSTSLHRAGRTRLERYCGETLVEFNAQAEAALAMRLNLMDGHDYSMSLGLAQHHGLPTPLLDWTLSPYIAAFFAFSDALEFRQMRPLETHVRIYGVKRIVEKNSTPPNVTLPFFRDYFAFLSISPRNNPRLNAQQGRFLVTNVEDLESYLANHEMKTGVKALVAVDVPIKCAEEALDDLYFMGLSASTMFPGLDGVCRMMKHAMLYKRAPLPVKK